MGQISVSGPDQMVLLNRALQIELEKRSAILSADGRELQRRTKESEEVLKQIRSATNPSATSISDEVKKIAMQLKKETDENVRLLENANGTLHKLITEMGQADNLYTPEQRKSPAPGGVLLDASV